jgi:peptidyl-prolyl cis-trans isomerase C
MFSNRPLAGYVLSVHPQKIDPPMTRLTLAAHATAVAIAVTLLLPLAASAQNIAIVNGKAVPKARLDLLLQQAQRAGQQVTPEMQGMAKDEVVRREMFAQEAEKRGIAGQADYKAQMELARQSILIRELFEDFKKKNPVTDAEAKAEYEKFKAQSTGTEFRASHILVESEEEAKALIAQIKGGAKFEDLAKAKSKDPGSGANGGDLDFAKPESYVQAEEWRNDRDPGQVAVWLAHHPPGRHPRGAIPRFRVSQAADPAAPGPGQTAEVPGRHAQGRQDRLQVRAVIGS